MDMDMDMDMELDLDLDLDLDLGDAFFVDATVRNPMATRYRAQGHSSTQDGFACTVAAQDKQRQ